MGLGNLEFAGLRLQKGDGCLLARNFFRMSILNLFFSVPEELKRLNKATKNITKFRCDVGLVGLCGG